METVQFKTKDGVTIVADWHPVENQKYAALLLHMMPSTRSSWHEFARRLNENGFAALAIDLRGHGDSTKSESGPLNYRDFSDKEHQSSIQDVESALRFLGEKGFKPEHIAIIGASIGANLALEELSLNPKIPTAVLLSAGLDYRGITTEPPARKLAKTQTVYLAATEEDMRSSGQTASQMAERLGQIIMNATLKIYPGMKHGTDMFIAHAELMDEIIGWLKKSYSS